MVSQLRQYLGQCDSEVTTVVAGLGRAGQAQGTRERVRGQARRAASACSPAGGTSVWALTVYSVPASLRGLGLDYAVSSLGVWAQEDAAPAMRLAASLALRPADPALRSRYLRLAGWAGQAAAAANAALARAATRLRLDPAPRIALRDLVPRGW